jgi:hypothetical protein
MIQDIDRTALVGARCARRDQPVRAQLIELGFAAGGAGGRFVRDDMTAIVEGDWLRLTVRSDSGQAGKPGRQEIGRPGLWRRVESEGSWDRICDLPLSVLEQLVDEPDGASEVAGPLAASLSWLVATAHEHLPRGWSPPPRDLLEQSMDTARWTVRDGPHASRGRLVCEPGRLAIAFPIVARIPGDLPPPRQRWLAAVLGAAGSTWRLVRTGLDRAVASGAGAWAEVDLSGAPYALIRSLFPVALDAVRCVVAWALGPAALTIDQRIESTILKQGPEHVRRLPASGMTHREERP